MSVTLKFVKAAYLKTYINPHEHTPPHHIVQMDQILRIKSKTKPPKTGLKEVDYRPADLVSIRKVRISAPAINGKLPSCRNNNFTPNEGLAYLIYDKPLSKDTDLVSIEVFGGEFCYPHREVQMPTLLGTKRKCGWIQVDFENGPIKVELFSGDGSLVNTFSVLDDQAFDISGYIMYREENGAWDGEKVYLTEAQAKLFEKEYTVLRERVVAIQPGDVITYESLPYVIFRVLEPSDGSGGGSPNS